MKNVLLTCMTLAAASMALTAEARPAGGGAPAVTDPNNQPAAGGAQVTTPPAVAQCDITAQNGVYTLNATYNHANGLITSDVKIFDYTLVSTDYTTQKYINFALYDENNGSFNPQNVQIYNAEYTDTTPVLEVTGFSHNVILKDEGGAVLRTFSNKRPFVYGFADDDVEIKGTIEYTLYISVPADKRKLLRSNKEYHVYFSYGCTNE